MAETLTASISPPTDIESATQLAELQATLQNIPCNELTYPGICEALIEAKARIKYLTEQRDTILKPLKAAEKAARDWFRHPLEVYTAVETTLKARVAGYQDELRRQKQLTIEAAGREPTPAAMAQLTALATPPTPAAISFRKIWKVEITDPNLVPRQFLLIDMAALHKACTDTEGQAQIPGVRFYQDQSVAVRS